MRSGTPAPEPFFRYQRPVPKSPMVCPTGGREATGHRSAPLHLAQEANRLLDDRCRCRLHDLNGSLSLSLPLADIPRRAGTEAQRRTRRDNSERNSIHQANPFAESNDGCMTEVAPNRVKAIVHIGNTLGQFVNPGCFSGGPPEHRGRRREKVPPATATGHRPSPSRST
jgi:hypothetical protein